MRNTKLLLSVAAASVLALNGCIDITRDDTLNVNYGGIDDGGAPNGDTIVTCTADNTVYSGTPITTDVTWNTDTCIDGKIIVEGGASITASDITVVAIAGSNAWIEVLPGGKLNATNVLFTSEEEASGGTGKAGQWGGVTLIGSANKYTDGTLNDQLKGYEVDGTLAGDGDISDSSGKLINCTLNNTGIAVNQEQEINGLSLVAVGNGTIISGLTVNRAGDDAVEIWGGHVNLTDVTIVGAGDDGFDNDDGWEGEVDGLSVSGVTNSGLELSGTTHATYKNVTIDTTGQVALDDRGGAIYLKGSGIGGFFDTVNIIDNADTLAGWGAIVIDDVDDGNLEGTGISISGTNTAQYITTGPGYIPLTDPNPSPTPEEVAALLGITLK